MIRSRHLTIFASLLESQLSHLLGGVTDFVGLGGREPKRFGAKVVENW